MSFTLDLPLPDAEHQRAMLALLANMGLAIGLLLLLPALISVAFMTLVLCTSLLDKLGARIKPDARKAVLVTGGTSGIGLEVAKHLHSLGFSVIVGYYNQQEPGYKELLELAEKPAKVAAKKASKPIAPIRRAHLLLVHMDVSSSTSIESADVEVERMLKQFDLELYALINNAGISLETSFEWTTKDSIRRTIDTNLTGTLLVSRQFVSKIIRARGKLIHLSSGLARFPGEGVSVYGPTKCAIGYFSDALAEDLRQYGVASVSIHPANLITNSNICLVRARGIQEAIEGLTEDERLLYKESIEKHGRSVDSLLRTKSKCSGGQLEELASVYKVKVPLMDEQACTRSCWSRCVDWVFSRLEGRVEATRGLQDSGILDAFESAVMMKRPPSHLYAGTRLYSLVLGASGELLPPKLSIIFGRYIMRNMCKR